MSLLKGRYGLKGKLGSLTEKAFLYFSFATFATVFLLQQMMAFPAQGMPSGSIRCDSVQSNPLAFPTIDIPAPHQKGQPVPSMDMEVEDFSSEDSDDGAGDLQPGPIFHQTLSEIAYLGIVKNRLQHLAATARNMPYVPCFVLNHCWKAYLA